MEIYLEVVPETGMSESWGMEAAIRCNIESGFLVLRVGGDISSEFKADALAAALEELRRLLSRLEG